MIDELTVKPRHVAIIMDGNGRWAKERGLDRVEGHKKGGEALRKVVRAAGELGIDYLSVYAFSTENWRRPKTEVSAIFKLLVDYCKNEIDELLYNNVKLNFIGDIDSMPMVEKMAMRNAEKKTAKSTGLVFNICINYGARQEIMRAIKNIISSGIEVDKIDESCISGHLYTAGIPDPDLIIRTSGEQRLSNFMLWQASYAEFVFTPQYWPDFDKQSLIEALEVYRNRKRRYGSI